MATTRRTALDVARAVARVKNDSVDDLWPDPAQLNDLPRSAAELGAFRREVSRVRPAGELRPGRQGVVPKRDGLMRTGHQLDPVQWVYYQSLVDSFLHRTEAAMESRDHIFGYRARLPRVSAKPFGKPMQQWLDFHRTVKEVAASGTFEAVVITDVAAFFEQVPHEILEDQLLMLGVPRPTAHELCQAITALMGGRRRGLPQGCDASSVVASMYLASLDRAMLRAGHAYYRYVDDIRIFARSEREARRLLRSAESEARKLGLNLQPGKTRVLVGAAQIRDEIVHADAEVDGIDYLWRHSTRRVALPAVKKTWNSASRRKAWDRRLIKFLINRLRVAKDPLAVNWCLARLGVLDRLADLVAPYLALFADRTSVQQAVAEHLRSDANATAFEASALLRMLLSARRVHRDILDYAAASLGDRNQDVAVRQWSAVLLGHAGDPADRRLVATYHLDDRHLARAVVAALQADAAVRSRVYGEIGVAFPELKPLVHRYSGFASPQWPRYPTW